MLNQNFALATASIARANRPDIVPQKNVDYLAAMRQAGSDWQEAQNTAKLQALANALKAKDQALIDNAYADVDPKGRASWLYDRTAKVEDRDAGFQHDFDMEDKRLASKIAAFDYQNRYASQKEKEQRAELDSFVQGLGLDKDKTMKLMAQIRGITVPEDTKISMIDSLTDEYLNPETTDERRGEILPQIEAYREREQQIRALIPSEPKKYTSKDAQDLQFLMDQGLSLQDALAYKSMMTPEEKIDFEAKKTAAVEGAKSPFELALEDKKSENAVNLEGVKQQGREDLANINFNNAKALKEHEAEIKKELNLQEMALSVQKANTENELKKSFEQFKAELPTDKVRNAQQISALTGEDVNNILLADYRKNQVEAQKALKEIEAKEAEIAFKKAQTEQLQNPIINPIEEFKQKERIKFDLKQEEENQKAMREAQKSAKQNEEMKPRVMQALERAKEALDEGTGLGQVSGWGWTTAQGGLNRAAIQSAQAQINTVMRGLLKEMGVGSTELNSAAEAAAYRYQISPDMPISQIRQIIDNFEKDYLDGTLAQDAAVTASQYGGQAPAYEEGTIAEDANGNRLIFRGGQWQKM